MRRRLLYLASLAVAFLAIVVRMNLFRDRIECSGPFGCEPVVVENHPLLRMWILIGGLGLAFLLAVAAMLEGALPPDDALPPPDDDRSDGR